MDRREKLLRGLDLTSSVGLELGPLDRPIVERHEGKILYADHVDAAALREKYLGNSQISQEAIVDVDVIWAEEGAQTLAPASTDYVIASHVIEHVPNLIGWLESIRRVLRDDGSLRLAVPDRRFTFDILRQETRLSDIVYAHLVGAKTPSAFHILDARLNSRRVDLAAAWRNELDHDCLHPSFAFDDVIGTAQHVIDHANYMDTHCWVFTPRHFAELFENACAIGLVKFKFEYFYDTAENHLEFFVGLKPCTDPQEAALSWRAMQTDAASLPPVKADGSQSPAILPAADATLQTENADLRRVIAELIRERDLIVNSRSWRLTSLLRLVRARLTHA